MKLTTTFYLILILFAFNANASEYLYQGKKGQHIVELHYSYQALGIDFVETSKNEEWNWNTQTIGLKYDWAINDMFSIGLGTKFKQINFEFNGLGGAGVNATVDWQASGLEGVDLYLKGNYGFGMMKLYYGMDWHFSIEDSEYSRDGKVRSDGNTQSGRDNASRGLFFFKPFLALEMNRSNMDFGLKVAYQVNPEQVQVTTDLTGNEIERKFESENGLYVSTFLEHKLNDASKLGYSVTYMTFEDLISKDDDSDGENNNKNYEFSTDGLVFDIYGNVMVSKGFFFLPKFSYYLLSDKDYKDRQANATFDLSKSEGKIESTGASYKIEFKLRKEF